MSKGERRSLSDRVRYAGNPAHNRNPGDFGLNPPAGPRPDKTLCDGASIFERAAAQRLLEAGIERGMVSSHYGAGNKLPQNVWAVTDDGVPLEAQLENPETGTYHGYPLPDTDPLREQVLAWWTTER
ncbi:MAG: hypothetical protein AB1726_08315 [Planctomycetota bacterium]